MNSPRGPLQYAAFLLYASRFDDFPHDFQPPWVNDPNYVAPDRGPAVIGVAAATMALATLAVLLRLWPRKQKPVRGWGVDDYMIIFSLAATAGYVVVQILSKTVGCIGRHTYDCTLNEDLYSYKIQFVGVLLYFACATFIKVSILFYLRRVNAEHKVAWSWIIDGTIVFSIITFLASFFMVVFQCQPISAAWDAGARIGHAKCMRPWRLIFAWAVVYTATDVWLILFPLVMFWRMRGKSQRLGVLFVTLWGVVATTATILKTIFVPKAYNTYDSTWKFLSVVLLSQIELAIGIVAACLPGLTYLFAGCIPALAQREQREPLPSELHSPSLADQKFGSSLPQLPLPEYGRFDVGDLTKAHIEKRMSDLGLDNGRHL